MVKLELSERDKRLIEIYQALYPFTDIVSEGSKWWIKSPDINECFTYKGLITTIENEIKEVLLTYVINGELGELTEV